MARMPPAFSDSRRWRDQQWRFEMLRAVRQSGHERENQNVPAGSFQHPPGAGDCGLDARVHAP